MAGQNWNNPTVASAYDPDFIETLKGRDVDAVTMEESPSNPPANYKRWNTSLSKFQNWSGSVWADLVLSVAGGGTGSSTAAGARTALGLGSMATQNNNAVTITGGTIAGVTMDASVITTGVIALNRGGTGASLSLGSSGQLLASNGSGVVFISGTSIPVLDAGNLSTGTIPNGRFPATLPAASGVNLTALNASNIASGTLSIARFPGTAVAWSMATGNYVQITPGGLVIGSPSGGFKGDGTINATNIYLNGVQVSAGDTIPSGMIALFDTSCPSGWTRYSALDGRFPRGASSAGGTGGASTHNHNVAGNTNTWASSTDDGNLGTEDHTTDLTGFGTTFTTVTNSGIHTHNDAVQLSFNVTSGDADTIPPYLDMVFCQKN